MNCYGFIYNDFGDIVLKFWYKCFLCSEVVRFNL